MPIGYPTPEPVTVAPSVTHGWPVLQSGGWTTDLYAQDGATAYNLASYSAVRYWREISEPFVGADLEAYNPALSLGYLRAFHRYLELLSRFTQPYGVAGYGQHSDGSELPGNFADQWVFRVTSQVGATITVLNSYAGCEDPRDLPITTSAGVNGARSCLQPWDVFVGPGWHAPWGLVKRVSFGSTYTTVYLHKEVSLDTPCVVGVTGNRYAPSNFDYPEPRSTEGARCLHCRLDPTGSLASGHATGLYSPTDPAYSGAPSATYLGEHWYCDAMRTASGVAEFQPGICALGTGGCNAYEAASPWPLIPAIALARLWLARNWYLGELIAGTDLSFAVRVEHPSLMGLVAGEYERYAQYGLLGKRRVIHPDMDLLGAIGPDNEWSQGVFLEDGSGVLVGAPARASWTGGTTASQADADVGSDRWKSMRCHALRRLGYVALNDPDALVAGASEYAVQRRRRRVRFFSGLSRTVEGAVQHAWGTTEFHPSGKDVLPTFESGLTLTITRERSAPAKIVATVWKSEITAEGLLKVQFLPGACPLEWVYTDPSTGATEARTQTVLAGGNVVDAPFWNRVLNPASGRDSLGCVYEQVQQGDSVSFSTEGLSDYRFTVVRAEAHGGHRFSGTIGGVSSATEPTSSGDNTTPILRGVPENWTPGASSVRIKADVVWLDWEGELGEKVATQANAYSPNLSQEGTFAGGTGTESDPYLISTPQMLQDVWDYQTDNAHFLVINDLDMTGVSFKPIGGTGLSMFRGTFDGGNHTISNLYTDAANWNGGLFNWVGTTTDAGYIRNVIVDTGTMRTGGLVNEMRRGEIENCHVRNATVTATRHLGGFVGTLGQTNTLNDPNASITRCSVTSTTVSTHTQYEYYVGGFVGLLYGTITESFAKDCVITAISSVGGFSGSHRGITEDCYAENCTVNRKSGTSTALGGFTGVVSANTGASRCYSTGKVRYQADPQPTDKGFAASVTAGGIFADNYWDMDASLQATTTSPITSDATGLTTAQAYQQSSYAGFDFGSIWQIDEGADYPRLQWETAVDWTPGSGDAAVFATAPIFAPKWAYRDDGSGLAFAQSGFGAYPVVKRHVAGASETLTADTDYLIDRSTGLIEFRKSVVDGWASNRFALSVDGYYLDAPNEMQAEVLTETRDALRRIDGCTLGLGDAVTLKVVGDAVNIAPAPNYGTHLYYYIRSDDSRSDPVQWVADTSGGSYGRVGVTHEFDTLSVYPNITVDYSLWGRLPARPLASGALRGWRPEWIRQAWADFTLTGAMIITRRRDFLDEGGVQHLIFDEVVEGDVRRVQIGTMTLQEGGTTDANAIVSGGQSFKLDDIDFAGETVHTLDITGALRAACSQGGGIPYLVVTGPGGVAMSSWDAGGESFRALASPWVKSSTCNGVTDPIVGPVFSALDVESWLCSFDVGIQIQNVRLQLDWTEIEADDLPDLPYGNWPPLA